LSTTSIRAEKTYDENRNVCATTQTESHTRRIHDPIIQGRRGHLYFDGGEFCLVVLDGKPAIRSKWEALVGSLWMGDTSNNAQGGRVQDLKITGIPLENGRLESGCAESRHSGL
jgi:hypothetical protein